MKDSALHASPVLKGPTAKGPGRKRSFLKGAAVDFGGSIVLILIGFITTPLVLRYLSDGEYGFWMTVMQALGLMGVLEMGASIAVTQKAADPALAEDPERLSGLMTSCLAIQLATGALILAVGLSLSENVFAWFKMDPASIPGSIGAFRAMVCWFAAGLVTGLYPALLSARQRMDLANGSAFVNQFLATLLPIPFLATGWGVTAFPAAQWIAGLSAFVLSYLWVSRILPRFHFRASAFRLGDLKSLLGFSIYNWIGKIAFLLTNAVDNLLVAAWLGAPAVTSFLLSSKLAAMVAPNMARLAASSMPGFAELYATGDTARRQASALVLHRLAARVALFGSALVLTVNHRFVASWVSESRYAGITFTVLLAALCLRDTLIKGTGVIIIASGQMKGFGLVTLAEAMGKIGLAYLFMKRMSLGLNGLLLAQLIPSLLLSTLYFPAKILHLTGLRPGRLLTQGLGVPFLRSLPSLAGLTLAAQLIPYHWGWLGIVLIAGVGAALNVSAFELPTFLRASGMPLGSRLRASLQVNF